ncbi:flagellar basal body-associated FliL family protein [Celeribacter arenosi]
MSEDTSSEDPAPKKKSKLPMLLGLVLMLALGGGGFFAVYSGLILGSDDSHASESDGHDEMPSIAAPVVAFVPIEPLIINVIDTSGRGHHLRFHAQLEVTPSTEDTVISLMPRIVDVLNGYLRAVEVSTLENPSALINLRAQILRRLQIVAGADRVKDVLIMEFVIN